MSRVLWAFAVIVLVAGATLMVLAYVTADNRDEELLAVLLLGIPTAALTLFLGSMALLWSRPRDRNVMRQTLLALIGSLVTPLALYSVWQAGPDLAALLFLALGVGAFALFFRDLPSGTTGAS